MRWPGLGRQAGEAEPLQFAQDVAQLRQQRAQFSSPAFACTAGSRQRMRPWGCGCARARPCSSSSRRKR